MKNIGKVDINRKIFLLVIGLCIGVCGWGQTPVIEFDTIELGPYGRGSSIAVLFKPKGVFPIGTTFELFLSDAAGNFPASTVKIGEYFSHYTTL